ncbi:hypothetical protein FB451DRAFT_1247620 [Mycena latifolia]|nr:hypothetical protein FB451DRAFT_1247620 [Mycena latifolia]
MTLGASAVRIYGLRLARELVGELVGALYIYYFAWPALTELFPPTAAAALSTASYIFGYLAADLHNAIDAAKAENATLEAIEEGKAPALPDGQAPEGRTEVVDIPVIRRKIVVLVLCAALFAADVWVRATERPPRTTAGVASMHLLSGLEMLFILVALFSMYRMRSAPDRCAGELAATADLEGKNDVETAEQSHVQEKNQSKEGSE